MSCPVIDGPGLAAVAAAVAAGQASARATVRQRAEMGVRRASDALSAAHDRYDGVLAGQAALRAGAAWAGQADAELAAARASVEEAEATLDACQAEQRRALAQLDRVVEQRATAAAAMTEAEQQLGDLGVAEMDESGLRRELEASGQAVRAAQAAHEAAVSALQERQAELARASERRAMLAEALGEGGTEPGDLAAVDAVAAALEAWDAAASLAGPDATATALADAWTDLQADLAGVAATAPLPDRAALIAAEARVVEAGTALARLEAETGAGALQPETRAAIEAAHEAVLAAEERAGRRLGGGGARRELERARAHEEDLLAHYGFATYIDVVLTGGRAHRDSPELLHAARTYRHAVAERDALVAATAARPELAYLDGERTRLHGHCVEVLGVDPGDDVVGLLRAHPAVPAPIVEALRDALAEVGVRPVGISLPEAASGWLAGHRSAITERERRQGSAAEAQAEVDELAGEIARLQGEVDAAESAVADAAQALEMAGRSVSAFESELSMRADEDAKRLQRFAAAEQLRHQIAALSSTLVSAEQEARGALERATTALAEADAALDRATARVADVGRRARSLVETLPADQRPEGDPVADLPDLAARLEARAEGCTEQLAQAESGRAAAAHDHAEAVAALEAAVAAASQVQPEDHLEALRAELAAGDDVIVLDEPFDQRPAEQRAELREIVLEASRRRAVVLLTADPELLGWAIELPASEGAVVAVDALNLKCADADEQEVNRAVLELSDAVEPSADAVPTPSARWAGHR
ncbi:MAG TPA: hypothetical protein VFV32_13455 [Acidimicrobiales bacterium]|nr:hypothetical protein [Acidimicrobiales bacterium]